MIDGMGVDLSHLRLNGRGLTANLANAIVGDPQITRTMEGASELTLTISDPYGKLSKNRIVREASRLTIDGLKFALVKTAKQGSNLNLTFEDDLIYRLRQRKGPKKAFRDKTTRALFVRSLVKEVDPDTRFICPELKKIQPIEDGKRPGRKTVKTREANEQREGGIPRGAKGLTVKGSPATLTQKRVADQVIREALKFNPPRRALVALLCAATHESVMGTLAMTPSTITDHDSVGLLQARLMYVSAKDAMSIAYNVRRFFKQPWTGTSAGGAIKQANAGRSIAEICTSIQGNATGDVYTQWKAEANNWIAAYNGGDSSSSLTTKTTVTKRYAFQVGKKENYWEAIKRLAEEVGWRVFVVRDALYFIAEPTLFKSRRRIWMGANPSGVALIDWDCDSGKKSHSATVTARAKTWVAPPGTVVGLSDDHGPAAGRWLVASIDGTLISPDVSITLKRPAKPQPEPKSETTTKTRTRRSRSRRTGGSSTGGLADVRISNTSSGNPHWGGSRAVFDQFIHQFMRKQGLSPGSQKRSYNTGQGLSDHYVGSTRGYATDYPTGSGESAARALARALGASYSPGSWNGSPITVDGKRFQCQILWAAPDGSHHDHVHVGLHRI